MNQEKKNLSKHLIDEAPIDEFEQIMKKMRTRGIEPRIKKQLKLLRGFRRAARFIQKPALVALLVVIILGGTSVGVSAKKAYDYKMKERVVGKSDVVWNNDQYVITEDDINDAYEQIKNQLNMQPLKLMSMPFGMKFQSISILDTVATMKFIHNDKEIWLIQSKNAVEASGNVRSDREGYKSVYNKWLDMSIAIEQNVLPDGDIEYSSSISKSGAIYHLTGAMTEEEFTEIVSWLSY